MVPVATGTHTLPKPARPNVKADAGQVQAGQPAYGSAAHDIALAADGKPATVIQLFAMGAKPSRNGKPAVVRVDNRAHADAIVAATAAWHRANDPCVDYDHQSLFGARPGVGGMARASGWMRRVWADDAGVWADVEWTAAASDALAAREYRYISPVFHHDAQGRVIRVINAALTNTPSLDLAAVASAFQNDVFSSEEEIAAMSMSLIAEALGLGTDASAEECLRAIASLSGGPKAAMTAIATALGVAADADQATLVAAATALKSGEVDATKFVPIAVVTELQTSVQSVQTELDSMRADKRKAKLDAASKDGKLTPALLAVASSFTDDAQLDSFLAALVPTNANKAMIDGGGKPVVSGGLTAEQMSVCSSMGWEPDVYLEMLKKEGAE